MLCIYLIIKRMKRSVAVYLSHHETHEKVLLQLVFGLLLQTGVMRVDHVVKLRPMHTHILSTGPIFGSFRPTVLVSAS